MQDSESLPSNPKLAEGLERYVTGANKGNGSSTRAARLALITQQKSNDRNFHNKYRPIIFSGETSPHM